MTRAIVTPPRMDDAPLVDLKDWLSITTRGEDAVLTALLVTAAALCERFTGLVPLPALYEERLAPVRVRASLVTRPVRRIVAIEQVAPDGTRSDASAAAEVRLRVDGRADIEMRRPVQGYLAIRFEAGAADGWTTLDASLAHGIVRLAAHNYRTRDRDGGEAVPAAIAALWHPHRVPKL